MSTISSLGARKILDSRDNWTIEVSLKTSDGIVATDSVPEGKSRGSFEAVSLSAEQAVKNIEEIIAPALVGFSVDDQQSIDEKLIDLDGTPNKSKLGANAILSASLVVARASALSKKMFLWQYLRTIADAEKIKNKTPRLFMNMINGGLHASGNLDFQEYIVIPKSKSITEEIDIGIKIYDALGHYLAKNFGAESARLGDEGGFAANFKDNLEPFSVIKIVVDKLGFGELVNFGLDAAASDVKLSAKELLPIYKEMRKSFNLYYLEDPFKEDDYKSFAEFKKEFGDQMMITGDDLTVTNIERIDKAAAMDCVNGIIIKPNQIGTLTETINAIKRVRELGWGIVVSHRSGETNDDFIADLAYGVKADGFKLGSPARGERVAKYNRLLAIEKEDN